MQRAGLQTARHDRRRHDESNCIRGPEDRALPTDGPVVWMKDASQNVLAASRLLNRKENGIYKRELDDHYRQLRDGYGHEQQTIVSLEEARKNKLKLW
jgi:cobalamin-dependent methionine synthase I